MTVDPVRALESWLAIARPVAAITQRLETALTQRHAISLGGYEVLAMLASRRGWTPMLDICESVELSQPRLSRLVAQIAEDGLVEREKMEHDGRAFQVRLTRKGRRVHGAAEETLLEVLARESEATGPVPKLLSEGFKAKDVGMPAGS